jgi:hypothetical protein
MQLVYGAELFWAEICKLPGRMAIATHGKIWQNSKMPFSCCIQCQRCQAKPILVTFCDHKNIVKCWCNRLRRPINGSLWQKSESTMAETSDSLH